ncbi:MAG TPA: ABC transporter permease subunit [Synergistaceae bacterium]|nr:ABC transporter permease subunit [Synergistaceae bacterium]HPJ25027.1 ABC transporter permease subunit [Synergistaceae bacterium]HPQ36688.1 ABC transporter permease subunit [Synergistaceae bacterium]
MRNKALLGGIGVLLGWEIVARILGIPLVLPSFLETLKRLLDFIQEASFWLALAQSVGEVGLVLLLVLSIGIPLGVLFGMRPGVLAFCRPLLAIIQAVPVISWLGVVVFSLGIGWRGPVFISTLSLLPMAILTTASGVRSLDETLLEMARIYRVPRWRRMRVIYGGALLPFTEAVIDVALGNAWKVVLVTEYLCGDAGLGVLIAWARQGVDTPGIYALSAVAVCLGIASERIFRNFRRAFRGGKKTCLS